MSFDAAAILKEVGNPSCSGVFEGPTHVTVVLEADAMTVTSGRVAWSGPVLSSSPDPVTAMGEAFAASGEDAFGLIGYDTIARHMGVDVPSGVHEPETVVLLPRVKLVLDRGDSSLHYVDRKGGFGTDVLDRVTKLSTPPSRARQRPLTVTSDVSDADYAERVRLMVTRIAGGEARQVGLSRELSVPFVEHPVDGYALMRRANAASPYSFCWQLGEVSVAGCSPQAFVTVDEGHITTRPIAGTRQKQDGVDVSELREALLADAKERAELMMLVDQAESDIRPLVSAGSFGSSRRPEVLELAHMLHTTCTVSGRLTSNVSVLEALLACAPAGTVVGHPRRAAMQISAGVEQRARGLYGGFAGQIGTTSADTCLAIRTVTFAGGLARCRAGAGIVAGSVPEAEAKESEAKAASVLAPLAAYAVDDDQASRLDR